MKSLLLLILTLTSVTAFAGGGFWHTGHLCKHKQSHAGPLRHSGPVSGVSCDDVDESIDPYSDIDDMPKMKISGELNSNESFSIDCKHPNGFEISFDLVSDKASAFIPSEGDHLKGSYVRNSGSGGKKSFLIGVKEGGTKIYAKLEMNSDESKLKGKIYVVGDIKKDEVMVFEKTVCSMSSAH